MVKAMSPLQHPEQSNALILKQQMGGSISCSICSAVYVPSQSHEYLLQTSMIALESAFMSMCHFCFRCRRPACPNCWDEMHGICGSCVQEVGLSFQVQTGPLPLDSTLLIPARRSATPPEPGAPAPLTCVRPGRFHPDDPPPATGILITKRTGSVVIEAESQPQQGRSEEFERHGSETGQALGAEKTSRVEQALPEGEEARTPLALMVSRVERILTVVVSLVLLVIAVLIMVASLSQEANMFIASTLQVDIRAEITYLLQLIQHLH